MSQVESAMENMSAQFAQEMYQYVREEVTKPADELAALGTDLQDLQTNQVSRERLQDLTTDSQVQAVDVRVTQLEATHRLYVDQAVTVAHTSL